MTSGEVSIGGGEATGPAPAGRLSGRTAWGRNLEAPLREFLRTETASAAILVAAAVAALVWLNAAPGSYHAVWNATLSVRISGAGVTQHLRLWVNDGLMTFFFFVVGLEARWEFDLGDLRDRRRLALPVAAGVCGAAAPIAIYLALNAGHASVRGWGAAMSTDTAFALGLLALVGRRFPDSLRAFILTAAVVDDLVGLLVITVAFTGSVAWGALAVGLAMCLVILALVRRRVVNGGPYAVLGAVAWVAFLKSGIDPVVVGLFLGLATIAYPAAREDLERATDVFRVFREQPTSELQHSARSAIRSAISPNEHLQQMYHPFTSFMVLPLFALANAGFPISGGFLAHAYGTPITLGILLAYVLGKPLGLTLGVGLVVRASRGRITVPVGWASVAGGGTIAGVGFTVSLLIASLAFHGRDLADAQLGILTTLILAPLSCSLVALVTQRLPPDLRLRALVGRAETIVDLAVPVDAGRDHIRGPGDAVVTLVEYGDLECPYCGQAETVIRDLVGQFGRELRYVWRHLPLNDVHPHAQLAAEASEAAAAQDRFWDMHDLMLGHQDALTLRNIVGYAEQLGLDMERFRGHLRKRKGAGRSAEDVESADRSGVSGTPTFFVNGHRHQGAYDVATLTAAVKLAGARATLAD